jgi:hypothetical protein
MKDELEKWRAIARWHEQEAKMNAHRAKQHEQERQKEEGKKWAARTALMAVGVIVLVGILNKLQEWQKATGQDWSWLAGPIVLFMVIGAPVTLGMISLVERLFEKRKKDDGSR